MYQKWPWNLNNLFESVLWARQFLVHDKIIKQFWRNLIINVIKFLCSLTWWQTPLLVKMWIFCCFVLWEKVLFALQLLCDHWGNIDSSTVCGDPWGVKSKFHLCASATKWKSHSSFLWKSSLSCGNMSFHLLASFMMSFQHLSRWRDWA